MIKTYSYSALFLQFLFVHSALWNMIHPRELSFIMTPAVLD